MSDLAYYRRLPYKRRVKPDAENEETFFLAWIEEVPGVKADGETKEEALLHLQQAFDDYVEAMLEWGDPIPEPRVWPSTIGDGPKGGERKRWKSPPDGDDALYMGPGASQVDPWTRMDEQPETAIAGSD